MTRDVTDNFQPTKIIHYGPGRPVRDGTDAAIVGELDLANNIQFLWAHHTPQVINQVCNHSIEATDPGWYVEKTEQGASGNVLMAFYLPLMRRWNTSAAAILRVYFRARMASGTNAGTITAKLHEENVSGTSTLQAFNVSPAFRWYYVDISHTDDAITEDILYIYLTDGSGGEEVQLHSISAYWLPHTPTTIVVGGEQKDGYLPFDSSEFVQDSPLGVELRGRMVANLDTIRKKRSDVIWAFSDVSDPRVGADDEAYSLQSTVPDPDSVCVRIKFRSKPGQTKIRWAAILQRQTTDVGFAFRVRTTHEVAQANGATDVGATIAEAHWVSTWDYTGSNNSFLSSWRTHADDGELDCFDDSVGEIVIIMQSRPGQMARLRGFTAWFKEVT